MHKDAPPEGVAVQELQVAIVRSDSASSRVADPAAPIEVMNLHQPQSAM